jgi:hypothetical protein
MTRKASKYAAKPQAEPAPVVETRIPTPVTTVETVVASPPAAPPAIDTTPIAQPTDTFAFDDFPVIDAVEIIEDLEILPDDAVAVVTEFSGLERPTNDKLGIELLGEVKFKGGDRRTVSLMICRGTDRKVVPGAQIMIKVLGSSFRPVIFHATSDANGLANVHLQLPHFEAGRAALLVRAMSDGQEIELRRAVTPG